MTVFFFHRFLLHLSSQSLVVEGPANLSVVETNAFKHLNHLSLRLVHGSDKDIKDYLAVCLCSLKVGSFMETLCFVEVCLGLLIFTK